MPTEHLEVQREVPARPPAGRTVGEPRHVDEVQAGPGDPADAVISVFLGIPLDRHTAAGRRSGLIAEDDHIHPADREAGTGRTEVTPVDNEAAGVVGVIGREPAIVGGPVHPPAEAFVAGERIRLSGQRVVPDRGVPLDLHHRSDLGAADRRRGNRTDCRQNK